MDFDRLYRSFAEAALRNAVRLGCRQLVSFAGNAGMTELPCLRVPPFGDRKAFLSEAGFDPRRRSFGELSDLSTQLPKADFERLLRDISALRSRSSSLVLSYAFVPFPGNHVLYAPLEMEPLLADCGFLVYEHPEPEELARQYFRDSAVLFLPGKRCLLAVKQ